MSDDIKADFITRHVKFGRTAVDTVFTFGEDVSVKLDKKTRKTWVVVNPRNIYRTGDYLTDSLASDQGLLWSIAKSGELEILRIQQSQERHRMAAWSTQLEKLRKQTHRY